MTITAAASSTAHVHSHRVTRRCAWLALIGSANSSEVTSTACTSSTEPRPSAAACSANPAPRHAAAQPPLAVTQQAQEQSQVPDGLVGDVVGGALVDHIADRDEEGGGEGEQSGDIRFGHQPPPVSIRTEPRYRAPKAWAQRPATCFNVWYSVRSLSTAFNGESASRRRVARQVRGSPRGGHEVTDMTISESGSPQDVEHSTPKPKPGPARPGPGSMRPGPGATRPAPGPRAGPGPPHPRRSQRSSVGRSPSLRTRRPGRHGVADHGIRGAHHRVVAGGRHRGRLRALRSTLRRPAHRGDAPRAAAGVRLRRGPQDPVCRIGPG